MNVDSETYVREVLVDRFEVLEGNVTAERALELMARALGKKLRVEDTTIVSLVGGAASGKSTLASSFKDVVEASGKTADIIGTDDYVIGNRAFRRDTIEGQDARTKYDFDFMNKKIAEIRANKDAAQTIAVPTYNQATGTAIAAGEENYTHHIGPVDVLIVEGDFSEVKNPDIRFFLHVPDANRLERRIQRDAAERNEPDPDKVIENFNLRQRTQQLPFTLPAMNTTDVVICARPVDQEWTFDIYQARI